MSQSPPQASKTERKPNATSSTKSSAGASANPEGVDPSIAAYTRAWRAIGDRITSGRSWSGRERNCLFLNAGAGEFVNASATAGFDLPEDGRALAATDWDRDGAVDLWITARSEPRLRLLRNQTKAGKVLRLRLQGTRANKDAIGAQVRVKLSDGREMTQTIRAGEGFLSQSSKFVTVSSGGTAVTSVSVRWPDGSEEPFAVPSGAAATLIQGQGVATLTRVDAVTWPKAPTKSPKVSSRLASASFLAQPPPMTPISITGLDGQERPLQLTSEHATLVVLWSRWCPPCMAELKELHNQRKRLAAAGLQVAALNVDRLSTTRDTGSENDITNDVLLGLLKTTAPSLVQRAGVLDDRNMARLEMLHRLLFSWRRPLPLPAGFLVDARGLFRAFYRGRVELERVVKDAEVAKMGLSAWRARAAAGPGQHQAPMKTMSWFAFGKFYLEHGHDDAALVYFEAAVGQDRKDANAHNMVGALHARAKRLVKAQAGFEAALAADPKHAQALANLANLMVGSRQLNRAIALYARAVAVDATNPVLRHAYGISLANAGKLASAKRQLLKARELDANAPVGRALQMIDAEPK